MTNLSGANLNNGAAVGPQGEGRDSPSTFPTYPVYKDSEVDWLGLLPNHWSKTKIGRVSQSGMGQTILKEMLEDVPSSFSLPVYSASEGDDAFGYFPNPSVRLKAGDLVVGARGSIGKTRLIVEDSTCTQTTIWVKPSKDVIFGEYLYWAFVGGRESLFPFDKTAIPMLTIDQLKQGWLALPSAFEQTQIVRFLDHETARIDALIEEQQRLIELLKEKRQALISHAVTKGLDPTVPMKDSGVEWLGEVPAHWVVLAIKWRARIKSGDGISPDLIENQAQDDKPHPVIGGNGVMGFTSQTNVSPPLIVIGRVGALCGNVHKIYEPAWVSDNALILDFDRRSFDINYLVHVLDARNLNEISDKSAQPLITGSKVTSQFIPCPSRHEQLEIAKFLEGALSEFDQLVLEGIKGIELLKERRSALISAAVTGKIDVRGWQPPASAQAPELAQEAV